jgi:hypothetical protein
LAAVEPAREEVARGLAAAGQVPVEVVQGQVVVPAVVAE